MSRSHTKGSRSRREVESLLDGGKVVKSYPGTSQYTQKGVSACGLASLNVAKNVLMVEMQGCTGRQLLEQMMYEEFMKHAIQICSYWSSPAHLEVEDILSLPSLAKALVSRGTRYGSPSLQGFSQLLGKIQKISTKAKRSAAAILTKPPEIFAILAIPVPADKVRRTPSTTVFVVFDSHSRPGSHSEGAAFTFFGTASGAAAYLEELLAVDETLTSPSQLDWQTELLSQFSAHLLVASESEHSMTLHEAELELFQTSIRSLELKAELDGLKASMEELQEKYNREREERTRVENELVEVRAELRKVKEAEARRESETRSFSTFSSSKGKERAMEIDEEIEYDDDLSNGFEIFASNDHHGDRRSRSLVARPPEKHGAEVQITTTSPPPKSGQFKDDVALALKLQEQFLEEDRFLQAQYSQLLGTAQQTFECGICMETYLEDTVAIVSGCSHDFCRDCLSTHVRTTLEGMRFPVLCPTCSTRQTRGGTYQGGVVTQQNVHTLGLSEEEYERWIEFELASHSILIECRK
ncbi:hypothetical protein FRC04_009220 [Tulasnella sp. 424]|nr:hypothetical protein FRC04_009220 [Tulasnella sp. 424]